MAGPVMDAACLTYEGFAVDPVETYFNTEEPVWILGKHFRPDEEMRKLNSDILSRLWFTYRKNFPPIGGTGPTSDTGWGCMLRCGQMMLGQAMLSRHLGRDWKWTPKTKDPTYMLILKAFLDKKDSLYSIHQIAQMGVGEGKQVGQWFGPNTIAQVMRKLLLFDDWSNLACHVAMDNTVVVEDVKKICKSSYSYWGCYGACTTPNDKEEAENHPPAGSYPSSHPHSCSCGQSSHSKKDKTTSGRGSSSRKFSFDRQPSCGQNSAISWRPLLLFIPLRLGLSDVNSAYYPALKVCFTLKQSLGFIGGKPNHAHYFIGFNGSTLLYLDPHTTQQTVSPARYSMIPDESYHCVYPYFMNFAELDPSIALGFYCHTEEDFDSLVKDINELIMEREKRPMFEIQDKRPTHWPPFEFPKRPCDDLESPITDFTELTYDYGDEDKTFDTDGEYEIL